MILTAISFTFLLGVVYIVYYLVEPFKKRLQSFPISVRGSREKALDTKAKFSLLFGILSGGIIGYGYTNLFFWLAQKNMEAFKGADFVFYPDRNVFLIPGLFLGLCAAMITTDLFMRLFYPSDYFEICREMKVYGGFQSAWSTRIYGISMMLVILLSSVFLVFFLDWYLVVKGDSVMVNQLGSFGLKEYPISQLQYIRVATHEKEKSGVREKYMVEIVLADGSKTRISDFGTTYSRQYMQRFINYLREKTGVEADVRGFWNEFHE